jgi:hypothetical protein
LLLMSPFLIGISTFLNLKSSFIPATNELHQPFLN